MRPSARWAALGNSHLPVSPSGASTVEQSNEGKQRLMIECRRRRLSLSEMGGSLAVLEALRDSPSLRYSSRMVTAGCPISSNTSRIPW